VEQVVRGSRFVTILDRTSNEEEARSLVDEVRQEFPDATHHCWAFVTGPPGSTARVGLSDDGEPHGTAGRPILETLLHSEIGEVGAVVTRYFGGTKLGRGGLGRAYSGGVKAALESLPTARRVRRISVVVQVPYDALDPLFHFLDSEDGVRVDERYGETATLEVALPERSLDALQRLVARITSGEGSVRTKEP
jgi:uncharacterized YigZ family protein